MSELNTTPRPGYKNRHVDGLPDKAVNMHIIINDLRGERVYLCKFEPFKPEKYTRQNMPSDGYLGTATTLDISHNIGFNVWRQNNHEFVYYSVVEPNPLVIL